MNYSFLTAARRGSNARNAMGERSELGYNPPVPVTVGDPNNDVEKTLLSVEGNSIRSGEVRREDGMASARTSYGTFVKTTHGSWTPRRQTTSRPYFWECISFGVLVIMGFVHWYGWGVGGKFGTLFWGRRVCAL